MTVFLPEALPASNGWALADFRDVSGQAVAGPDGVATVEFDQLGSGEMWLVDHAVISCNSTAATQMRLYASVPTDRALLDGSIRGAFDVADWPGGLRVAPVTSLLAQWTGATPGATATITLQVRVMRRQ